ncbi:hypothetical protein [Bradyrhizobium sp. WSM1253]|uniref:hypothetical protein n=1 Tax=Bradyrhizobium sp. WSM1253 TaxID=319003 RepID=UPI00025D2E30|nr:hypothetical protein [Bradyrhizobium sp. WSM1253]EIG62905.1 hypothetical protein Bra1253DRAFT_07849 [Bradyrhizobium sp. WSM1253]
MTDTENLAAGALSAGIDLIVPPPTMSDIKATAAELLAHIEDIHMSTEGSLWLKNARANVRAVLLCIDSHLAEFEEKAKAEVAKIEAKLDEPPSKADAVALGSLMLGALII